MFTIIWYHLILPDANIKSGMPALNTPIKASTIIKFEKIIKLAGTAPNHQEKIHSGATKKGEATNSSIRNEYFEAITTKVSLRSLSPAA